MKNRITTCSILVFVIALFSSVPSSSLAEKSKTVKVFLLGGQSNMLGADKAEKLESPYSEALPKVRIWHPATKDWAALSPESVNTRDRGCFGPEISFGHAMANTFPADDVRLVKYAVGGRSLYEDWAPAKGMTYDKFMRTAKEALVDLDAEGVAYEVAGMLWLQGESDAEEAQAESYKKNLSEFIVHMRTEFKTAKMPFVIARVRSHYGGETGQAQIVRDAQKEMGESMEQVAWFDTDDCSMLNAGHYDADGLILIGKRFAETYTAMLNEATAER
jgi:hypothetical protein